VTYIQKLFSQFCLFICFYSCMSYYYIGLVVFILRITVSAIYLASWLLFTFCMSVLHCSVDFNQLYDDDKKKNNLFSTKHVQTNTNTDVTNKMWKSLSHPSWPPIYSYFSVSGKMGPKCFFCNISYKTRAILVKYLVHRFPNKSAAKSCKQFPPYLNNVSTLPCET